MYFSSKLALVFIDSVLTLDLVSFKKLQPKDQAKHFLEIIISKAVDNISNSKVHKLKATVPVITITVGDQNRECAVDLSFNNIGLAKTMFMHRLYASNCKTFILLWVLVRWARAVGMIKSGMEAQDLPQQPELRREDKTVNIEGLLATAEFYVLVIHLLDLKPTEEKFENKKERNKKAKKVCFFIFFCRQGVYYIRIEVPPPSEGVTKQSKID